MWYILQTITFCYVVYVYMAEIQTHQPVGAVLVMAALVALGVTKLLALLLDLTGKLISVTIDTLVNPRLLLLPVQKLRLSWRRKQLQKRLGIRTRGPGSGEPPLVL